ncbi:MAG: TRAP transporter small permease [Desulfopila sp.]
MHTLISRVTRIFTRIFAAGASFSMVLLFLIVFVNSVRRYAIGKSLEWGEELPVFIAIYGIMFGVALAYLQDRHIRFTMLVGFLSEKSTRLLYAVVDLVMVVIGVMLTWSGWQFMMKRGGMESSGLINSAKVLREVTGWDFMIWFGHLYPYQAAMVLGGVMLTIAAILKFFGRLTAEKSNFTISEVL